MTSGATGPDHGGGLPVFVLPDAGEVLEIVGVTHKLTSRQSGGAIFVFESGFDPGAGNGLHIHHHEVELGYVLEGALEVRLGSASHILETGGLAYLPTNVPHALRNPLEVRSRYLFMAVPGGLERYFLAIAQAHNDGSLDDAVRMRLALDSGLEWLE